MARKFWRHHLVLPLIVGLMWIAPNKIGTNNAVQCLPDAPKQTAILNWFRPPAKQLDEPKEKHLVGIAVEVSATEASALRQYQANETQVPSSIRLREVEGGGEVSRKLKRADVSHKNLVVLVNHSFLVSHICRQNEQLMSVNIRTNRPFYGLIQGLKSVTRQQANADRHQPLGSCSIEGNGEREFNLTFSYVQPIAVGQPADWPLSAKYCGPLASERFRSLVSDDLDSIYSIVLAIQLHKDAQSSEDRVVPLNCTQVGPACRGGSSKCAGRQQQQQQQQQSDRLLTIDEDESDPNSRWRNYNGRTPNEFDRPTNGQRVNMNQTTCDIWKFPRFIVLFWCFTILLIGMLASNCLMCLSLISKAKESKKNGKLKATVRGTPRRRDVPQTHAEIVDKSRISHNQVPFVINYNNEELGPSRPPENMNRAGKVARNERIIR